MEHVLTQKYSEMYRSVHFTGFGASLSRCDSKIWLYVVLKGGEGQKNKVTKLALLFGRECTRFIDWKM